MESNRIEYKECLTDSLEKEVVAFLNYKELMRVFRNLELVEQLGSGIPRILEKYDEKAFEIRSGFVRGIFYFKRPFEQITEQITLRSNRGRRCYA